MQNFTPEIIEKARTAQSAEELLEISKANNVEMTAEEAGIYYEQLNHQVGELQDDELNQISGGSLCFFKEDERQRAIEETKIGNVFCPQCGALGNWSVYQICKGGYVWQCNACKQRGVLEESDGYSVMHTGYD